MSFVNLLLVKDKKVLFKRMHYREALDLLWKEKFDLKLHHGLDAGYIVIDVDRKQIINSQNAFYLRLKGWDQLDL